MSNYAIEINQLKKTYRIYNHSSDILKEAISFFKKKYHKEHQALKGIDLKIKHGEFLGILGKNGAGKSTLLKILSSELNPSSGEFKVHGVVSLLQLGVGFNKELSGKDNVIFSCQMMGYDSQRTKEVIRNVEDFSELNEFFYYPLKTYSSGMYSRLAFSTGINIDPDILIIDEVLSVGDTRFTQKCLEKMRSLKKEGKTIVLVSHSTSAIASFCDRAIWLKDGYVFMNGDPHEVVESYQSYMAYNILPEDEKKKKVSEKKVPEPKKAAEPIKENIPTQKGKWISTEGILSSGEKTAYIEKASCTQAGKEEMQAKFNGDEKICISAVVKSTKDHENCYLGWILKNKQGVTLLHSNTEIAGLAISKVKQDEKILIEHEFNLPHLNTGEYVFSIAFHSNKKVTHRIPSMFIINVVRPDFIQQGTILVKEQKADFKTLSEDT